MRPRTLLYVVFFAALFGFLFAAFSTYDFVAHLDRQVHGIHCSFLPGLQNEDASASSGCHVTLMSPYSSVFRRWLWGGIPVSLPAMGLFAFLAYWAINLLWTRRELDPNATGFLAAVATVPFLTSIVMAYLALVELDAVCKLCIGIYTTSTLAFVAALMVWRGARRPREPERTARGDVHREGATPSTYVLRPTPMDRGGVWTAAFLGGAFIALPLVAYAASAPDFSRYVGACGQLAKPENAEDALIPIGPQSGGHEAVEVLDPLCSACKAFEKRLQASGMATELKRKALLFPLDNECNWMVGSAVHPGACALSEAVLCAGAGAEAVLGWAFENQESILQTTKTDPKAAARLVLERFPELKACVGKPAVRARLNRALRWAVANELPVVTPQLFVGNKKVCDEDTDLGMDFVLSRLLRQGGAGPQR